MTEDACDHGAPYDAECGPCDEMGARLKEFGAETPRELGIAERAFWAGRVSVAPVADATVHTPQTLPFTQPEETP